MKVEKAARELVDLLLTSEGMAMALESTTVSGRTTPATTLSLSVPKVSSLHVDEMDLKPGEYSDNTPISPHSFLRRLYNYNFCLHEGELTQMRAAKRREDLKHEAFFLLEHFEQRNLDALIKLTRSTLENIRRRVTPPSSLLYGESADQRKSDHRPAFKVQLALAIPNVMLKPRLEEIQKSLNATVQCIVGVHKYVYQWGQAREGTQGQLGGDIQGASMAQVSAAPGQLSATSTVMQASQSQLVAAAAKKPTDLRNFFRSVSEHKEVAKLVSLLSTTFSSAKILIDRALEYFKDYQQLWMEEKEQSVAEFLESKPTLSEFEARIREYEKKEAADRKSVV